MNRKITELVKELNKEIEKEKKPKCPHPADKIQSFTEVCLQCGKNIWLDD